MPKPVGCGLRPIVTGTALTKKSHLLFRAHVLAARGAQSRQQLLVSLAGELMQFTARHAVEHLDRTAKALGHPRRREFSKLPHRYQA